MQDFNEAIKQDLIDSLGAIDCWQFHENTDADFGFQYRLIFEIENFKGRADRADRAVRYVDIMMEGSVIQAQLHNRHSIKVDCAAPGSIEVLEKFVLENCTKRRESIREWSGFGPRSSIG